MDKQNEGSGEGKCGCGSSGCSGSCGGCCWGKAAVGLFLLLVGFLMGLFLGRSYRGCAAGGCPVSGMMCPVSGTASAPAK